ncbi:MAG: hypothetical protein WC549_09665 [Actinomycetota bacterium]
MKVDMPVSEFLNRWIGKIKGYERDKEGVSYYSDNMEDNFYFIRGERLIESLLDKLGTYLRYDIKDEKVIIDFDPRMVRSFMRDSGYRDMDYSIPEAKDDISDAWEYILSRLIKEFEVRIDPYSYTEYDEDGAREESKFIMQEDINSMGYAPGVKVEYEGMIIEIEEVGDDGLGGYEEEGYWQWIDLSERDYKNWPEVIGE